MATDLNFGDANLTIGGIVTGGEWRPGTGLARTYNVQETVQPFRVPLEWLRVWNDPAALLPNAAVGDDLGLVPGTLGTDPWQVHAGDVKNTTSTRYAAFHFPLPVEYDNGETITLRVLGACEDTVCDTRCDVDVECYPVRPLWHELSPTPTGSGSVQSDACATAAQSINSLTPANKDFVITPTNLQSGDLLHIRIAIDYEDATVGDSNNPYIYAIWMMLDIKG